MAVTCGLEEDQCVAVLILIERLCALAYKRGQPLLLNSLTIHR